MPDEPLLVIGAGGFAREVAWLIADCAAAGGAIRAACFVERDDGPAVGGALNGLPVLAMAGARARFPGARAVVAVGSPRLRERLAAEAAAQGFAFATLVHPAVARSARVEIGEGSVICAATVVTVNVRIGRHVQINPGATVMHDAEIGDFATLAPGVRVSGAVRIGRAAFIGAGAVIVNGTPERPIRIGDYATVGACACVLGDVAPGATVAGVPAHPTRGD
ncbi:MAG: NeuD/PglB/VioB family sugar acetyltransferase [Proteobacteria bacterium]|nr:NeuD/PglB/VioB family sugar acetyltransferase [Pseudomonadota bacterium]